MEELSINDLIKKRKERWQERGDMLYDRELTRAIADKILDTKTLREEIIKKPYLLIEACFSIVDKKKRTIPFFLNGVQRDFIEKIETYGTKKPYFVLKGRQQGFTTVITAIQLSYAIVKRNFAGFTLADRDDNTKAIFVDKAKLMYSLLPDRLRPTEKFNSVNELYFDKLNSSWRVASATGNVGRSRTLSFIHYSEVAFFRCALSDLQKSIAQAATEDALCIYETTANGFNEAKELWDSGSCNNLFYEWWKSEEYTSDEYEYLKMGDAWLQNRLKILKQRGLRREQLAWYAKKYCSYIDKSSIRQEYPCTPEEAFISSGECVFNKEAVSYYLATLDVPFVRGNFVYDKHLEPITLDGVCRDVKKVISNIRFEESEYGYVKIVEMPRERAENGSLIRRPYVIGADTAGCGKDYFSAKVIDNTNGKCVATLHKQQLDEDLFAEQLYCLGKFYNDALIGVETNHSRHPVRVLRSLGYESLYVSRSVTGFYDKSESFYGFVTTSLTRPIIISNLVSVMRENLYLETDRETLVEMTTFIKRDDGKWAAADGAHDDLVMASAIARFIGIDYPHEEQIVDTARTFLEKSFSLPTLQEETFMEW